MISILLTCINEFVAVSSPYILSPKYFQTLVLSSKDFGSFNESQDRSLKVCVRLTIIDQHRRFTYCDRMVGVAAR